MDIHKSLPMRFARDTSCYAVTKRRAGLQHLLGEHGPGGRGYGAAAAQGQVGVDEVRQRPGCICALALRVIMALSALSDLQSSCCPPGRH